MYPEPTNINEAFRQFVLSGYDNQFKIGELSKKSQMSLFEECFTFKSKYTDRKLHVTIYDVTNWHKVKIMHINKEKQTFTYSHETKERDFFDNIDDIFVCAYFYHCQKYGFPLNNEKLFGRNDEYKLRMFQECSITSCGSSQEKLVWKIRKKIDGVYRYTKIHLPVNKRRSRQMNRKLIKKLYFERKIKNVQLISIVLNLDQKHTEKIIKEMRREYE